MERKIIPDFVQCRGITSVTPDDTMFTAASKMANANVAEWVDDVDQVGFVAEDILCRHGDSRWPPRTGSDKRWCASTASRRGRQRWPAW